jgi:hypothetical protein
MVTGCPNKWGGSEATLVVLEIVYVPIYDVYICRVLGDGCGQHTRHDNKRKDDLNEERGADGTTVKFPASHTLEISRQQHQQRAEARTT